MFRRLRIVCLALLGCWLPGEGQSLIPVYQQTISASEQSTLDWRSPSALDVGPRGDLYVADVGTHQIYHLDGQGRLVSVRGGYGWDLGAYREPVAVDASSGLDVFVADRENQRVQRLDKDLHTLSVLLATEAWPEALRFRRPLDVAFSGLGELFILDEDNRNVLRVDGRGEPLLTLGGLDAGEGRLERPRNLLWLKGGRVAVSDGGRKAVLLFTEEGDFLLSMGQDTLQSPSALATVENRLLLVLDLDPGEPAVRVFSLGGRFLTSWGADLLGLDRLNGTVDLAVHGQTLYLLNARTRTIALFTLHASPVPWSP